MRSELTRQRTLIESQRHQARAALGGRDRLTFARYLEDFHRRKCAHACGVGDVDWSMKAKEERVTRTNRRWSLPLKLKLATVVLLGAPHLLIVAVIVVIPVTFRAT